MEIKEAQALLQKAFSQRPNTPQQWADLGCGTGTFSLALAGLLPEDSHITCVDKQDSFSHDREHQGVQLDFIKADFTKFDLSSTNYDGFLMANSLHYIRKQQNFLTELKEHLAPNGRILLVEYDTRRRSPWIPYPIPFQKLEKWSAQIGFESTTYLGERNSIYGSQKMYAGALFC